MDLIFVTRKHIFEYVITKPQISCSTHQLCFHFTDSMIQNNMQLCTKFLAIFCGCTGPSRNVAQFSELVEKTEFRDQDVIDEEVQRKMSSGSLFPSYTTGSGGSIEVKNRVPEDLRQAMQIVTDEDFPNSKWLYDTPGLINEDQVC